MAIQTTSRLQRFRKLGPYLLLGAFLAASALAALIVAADWRISNFAQGRHFDQVNEVSKHRVGLLLGTAPQLADGRANLYFEHRIAAAVELFGAGKVQYILVSGDNGSRGYDEPTAFLERLEREGIPRERIYLDYAGFRTLDSVVRAKEVFGQANFVVISQRFHNERAIYLANHYGIEAQGFNAQAVAGVGGMKMKVREALARCKVFLDLYFGVEPKFLGEAIEIPTTTARPGGEEITVQSPQ